MRNARVPADADGLCVCVGVVCVDLCVRRTRMMMIDRDGLR